MEKSAKISSIKKNPPKYLDDIHSPLGVIAEILSGDELMTDY